MQNAEDALRRRRPRGGNRSVCFALGERDLRVSHFGRPFDEDDVRGICGIAESTKDLTAIGRFGIGFKSVYAFTERPEVYSGVESFAIESFVWPVAVPTIQRKTEETLVVLPLRNTSDRSDIEAGLRRLGPGSLLFLREIEEIEWSVEGGSSGLYLRSEPEWLAEDVRRVTVIGQVTGCEDIEESWLIFSGKVRTTNGQEAGYVEVAFCVYNDDTEGRERLRAIPKSRLVVFFPTALETHLGFLVQGPYRTTPSRDNVPSYDTWNQRCVAATARVLRDALHWLRDHELLDVEALRCLPLDRAKFPDDEIFAPIFEEVREALLNEELLPRYDRGYAAGHQAVLARTRELRDLLTPVQLGALLGADDELVWLSGDISLDRSPELRKYLVKELGIEEVRPEIILSKLSAEFLEAQPDEWVRSLYEFLSDQRALYSRAKELPLIRLADGKHSHAQVNGRTQVFLPGRVATGFPTVRSAVCDTREALKFLQALGLKFPDLVDDVIANILPRYSAEP